MIGKVAEGAIGIVVAIGLIGAIWGLVDLWRHLGPRTQRRRGKDALDRRR